LEELKYIFKLSKISGKPKKDGFLSAIVTESQNEIGALIGTPCIVDKYKCKTGSESTPALFTFPTVGGRHPSAAYSLRNHQIKIGGESFINTHKVKIITELDMNKFEDLSEYVNEYGAITFRLSEFDCPYAGVVFVRRFVTKTLPDIIGRFKNHTVQEMFYYLDSEPYFKNVSCHLTFLDIRHCLPVFSAIRDVKGICLILKIGSERVYRKANMNVDYFTMSMVFSDKLEGVFFVDGIQINSINKISKTATDNMDKWIEKILKKKRGRNKKEILKRGKNKKKMEEEAEYIKVSDVTNAHHTISINFHTLYTNTNTGACINTNTNTGACITNY